MILLDTNIYIRAFNEAAFAAEFAAFQRAALPRLLLSAVVVHELLLGAGTPAERRQVERGLVEPFRSRRRLHVPTLATWQLAAELDGRLRVQRRYAGSLAQRSFGHDLLLAASAREVGATLVTQNLSDFTLIARGGLPLRVAPPWPELAPAN